MIATQSTQALKKHLQFPDFQPTAYLDTDIIIIMLICCSPAFIAPALGADGSFKIAMQ